MPGEYGDIIWRRPDPKTVELSNVPPPPTIAEAGPEAGQEARPTSAAGKAAADQEWAALQAMMAAEERYQPSFMERARAASPEQKRAWRREMRNLDRYMREGGSGVAGFQALIDSGAATYEEDGVYSAVRLRGKGALERFVQAGDAWADAMGLWDEQGNYNPAGRPGTGQFETWAASPGGQR